MFSIFAISLAASLPIFGLDLYLAWANPTQVGLLAVLTVTLPRQLTAITTFRNLFVQIISVNNFSTRFQSALFSSELNVLNVMDHIRITEVLVDGSPVESLPELLKLISLRANGRMTISGPNGAGKSTLLAKLNQELPNSLLIPANPALEIGSNHAESSTGQRVLMHLKFAASESVPVLLLDEWDADLDSVNALEISSMLDSLSKIRLIIEVRHRSSSQQ